MYVVPFAFSHVKEHDDLVRLLRVETDSRVIGRGENTREDLPTPCCPVASVPWYGGCNGRSGLSHGLSSPKVRPTPGSAAAPARECARGGRDHSSVTSAAAERRRQLHPVVVRPRRSRAHPLRSALDDTSSVGRGEAAYDPVPPPLRQRSVNRTRPAFCSVAP